MRGWVQSIIALGASHGGVFLLAFLDSTIFIVLPFGIDLAVIGLAARGGAWVWTIPLLATVGSALGAAGTYWLGSKVGEQGLERFASARRVERIRARTQDTSPVMLTGFHLMPPPFPFTLFVLAAGALQLRWSTFFTTLTLARLARFGAETALAVVYGRRIAGWLTSEVVTDVITWLLIGCAAATLLTIARLVYGRRQQLAPAA